MQTAKNGSKGNGAKTNAKVESGPRFIGEHAKDLPLNRYKPNDWNPNKMSKRKREAFRRVLAERGWSRSQAIFVWATDEKGEKQNIIIDGEHRWDEAQKAGFTKGPVVEMHGITRKQAAEWTLILDKNRGEFEEHALARVLEEEIGGLANFDEGISLGFHDDELRDLQKLLRSAETNGPNLGEQEEKAPPAPPKNPVTKDGDLWKLGPHRLYCGDTFDEAARKACLGSSVTDCVVTDPPYAIYGSSTGIGADIADDLMVRPFFEKLFAIIYERLKEFGHAYVCCDWRTWSAIWESCKRAQITGKNCLVWDKGSSGLGSNYANTHEFVGFFAKLPPPTAMKSTTKRGQRMVHKPNMLRHNRVSGDERKHNAAKPIRMLHELIENSTDKGELVVDFFGGSGSTLLAADQCGRIASLFEIKPGWCDVIVQRWEEATGGKASRSSP